MVPLPEHDPRLWDRQRIGEADAAALQELASLDGAELASFAPYHAVRADFPARVGRHGEARQAYETVLSLDPPPSGERGIRHELTMLDNGAARPS